MADIKIIQGTSQPFFSGAPYGDYMEVSGPPQLTVIPEPYSEFFRTDARTVMIILHPQHFNFFINPAFRVDDAGWELEPAEGKLLTKVGLYEGDSWVGKSLQVTGSGSIRFRDLDKDGNPAFVYVGPSKDLTQADWFEPGRGSARWTASVYVSGTKSMEEGPFIKPARARLVMEAYRPTDGTKAKSPPEHIDVVEVADPNTEPYGPEAVKDDGDEIWTRMLPPFYRLVGKPSTHPDPGSITDAELSLPAVVRDPGDGTLWSEITPYPSAVPYYEFLVDPPYQDPGTYPGPDPYIQDTAGNLYAFNPVAQGEPYYQPHHLPLVDSPETVLPDKSQMPHHLLDPAGDLWVMKSPTAQDGTPYYEVVGTPAPYPMDPDDPDQVPILEAPPGADLVILTATRPPVPANGEPEMWPFEDEVWELIGPPYYESTGTEAYFASSTGPWFDLETDDWTRIFARTAAWDYVEDGRISFQDAFWIDVRLEVENVDGMLASAFMLDPTEAESLSPADAPLAASYFDGSMTEDQDIDDFIWSEVDADGKEMANQCISMYYYDRMARVRWMWENLKFVVPVDRPYQIFFGHYRRPYVPPTDISTSVSSPNRSGKFSL